MKRIFTTVLVAFLGGFAALTANNYFNNGDAFSFKKNSKEEQLNKNFFNTSFFSNVGNFNFDENSFINASEKTIHSVVHVKNMTVSPQVNSIFDLLFGNPSSYQQNGEERLAGTGSGVIISPDGYIVTNNHVIKGASSVEVTLNNNKTYKAEIVGADTSSDIALLKIKASEKLQYLTFADSDSTKVGQWVLAVGNPFNLTSTVTAGIISAKARNLNEGYSDKVESFIQTDAAVNPGNSGGALVNLNGDLIGINTAITSSSGTFIGYSFAVPSNIAKKVVEDLIEYGNVQKGVVGITLIELNSEVAKELKTDQTEGVYVNDVEPDSGADIAGIKKGDVIKEIDGIKIKNNADINGYTNTKRPGDKINIKLLRGNSLKDFSVKLQKNTSYTASALGMQVKELTDKDKKAFKTQKGVKITQAVDYYKQNGVDVVGKILLSVNDQDITSVDQLKNIIENKLTKRNLIVILNQKGEKERILL